MKHSKRKIGRAKHVYLGMYKKWQKVTHFTLFVDREPKLFRNLLKAASRLDNSSPLPYKPDEN